MPSIILVKINHHAVGAILKGAAVQADLLRRATRIADTAGDGYEADVEVGWDRAYAVAVTRTTVAMLDEAKNHTLLRALQAGA